MKDYRCSDCGKEHVKLWRPFGDDDPLICAECAEKNQIAQKAWTFNSVGDSIVEMIKAPKWKVDENGEIPNYSHDVVSDSEENRPKTNYLIVDISHISSRYGRSIFGTTMVPAIPHDGTDSFYTLPTSDNEAFKWWCNLPTR